MSEETAVMSLPRRALLKKLDICIFAFTVLAVTLSIRLYYVSNQLNDTTYDYIENSRLSDRFASKNDTIEILSFLLGDAVPVSYPRQAYQYLLAAKGQYTFSSEELEEIRSVSDYREKNPEKILEEANRKSTKLFSDVEGLRLKQGRINIYLILVQAFLILASLCCLTLKRVGERRTPQGAAAP